MRVSRSIPLVQYLLKNDIVFITDADELILDDEDYKILIGMLSSDQKHKHMINLMLVGDKQPKKRKEHSGESHHEAFKRPIPDEPKKIKRPAAVYSNPNYKTMYLEN